MGPGEFFYGAHAHDTIPAGAELVPAPAQHTNPVDVVLDHTPAPVGLVIVAGIAAVPALIAAAAALTMALGGTL